MRDTEEESDVLSMKPCSATEPQSEKLNKHEIGTPAISPLKMSTYLLSPGYPAAHAAVWIK